MPKLSHFREKEYNYFSGKVSELIHNLSFAGIAIIWIFKTDQTGITIDKEFILPLISFIASLAFGLFHYLWGTIIWGYFTRKAEKKLTDVATEDPELKAPAWYNWPTNTFFCLKTIFLTIGYILLFRHLVRYIA
ncbi:MAG: hypothetical protein QG657_4718 [Acidobacteriota bacterium]|nr:hypothetical protein [Acidobacteriota bacterium]